MFVLGCHRSGTSLLASIISDALVPPDSTKQQEQLPPQLDNPGGFFESRQLVNMNEDLLAQLGIHWQYPPLHAIQWQLGEILPKLHAARETFATQAMNHAWVDKDPRLCLTYPAYQHILLKRTPIAAVVRHPFEVAGSLQARDMIPLAKGLIIWFLYNQHLSRLLAPEDILISYDSLVNNEDSTISAITTFIAHHTPECNCTIESVKALLGKRAQQDWKRNHNTMPQTLLPEIEWTELADLCAERYEAISQSDFNITQFQSSFASTPDAVLRGSAVLGWQTKPQFPKDVSAELEAALLEVHRLKSSSSWKLTAPLRWFANKVKFK